MHARFNHLLPAALLIVACNSQNIPATGGAKAAQTVRAAAPNSFYRIGATVGITGQCDFSVINNAGKPVTEYPFDIARRGIIELVATNTGARFYFEPIADAQPAPVRGKNPQFVLDGDVGEFEIAHNAELNTHEICIRCCTDEQCNPSCESENDPRVRIVAQ